MDPLVAWAAGFFDGEGCITVFTSTERQKHNGRTYTYEREIIRINVGQKVLEPLLRMKELFGGSVTKKQYGGVYHWRLQGKGAIEALERMLPLLTVKEEKAMETIERRKKTA